MNSFRAKNYATPLNLVTRLGSEIYICMASALGSVNPRDEENSFVAGVAVAHTPVLYVAPLLALGLTLWCPLWWKQM